MIVYEKNNFAFLHINKTGGLTIKHILNELVGKHTSGIDQHRTLKFEYIRKATRYPDFDICKIPIYTNVRNPFDRIVSMYAYRKFRLNYKQRGITFKNFFYNIYMKGNVVNGPISEFLLVNAGLPKNVNVVRLEDIDKEWPKIIKKHFNKDIGNIPKINKSNKLTAYTFNSKMIDLVLDREKWVIKNYYPELEDKSGH